MHPNAYFDLAQQETTNWYYRARARMLRQVLQKFYQPTAKLRRVLDVGSGTGGTSQVMCEFGSVTGIESWTPARELSQQNFPQIKVVAGDVTKVAQLFPNEKFDLATIMGVLYHEQIPNPEGVLRQLNQVLSPNGLLLWNDAAHPILKRQHDRFVSGSRRFKPAAMRQMVAEAGFEIVLARHYFNWGFFPALLLAMADRLKSNDAGPASNAVHSADDHALPHWINEILFRIMNIEWWINWRFPLPFGVSYLILARRQNSDELARNI